MNGFSKKSRHKARLAAIQALYQMELTETGSKLAISEFENYWQTLDADADGKNFFEMLVLGVVSEQEKIDASIRSRLSDNWKLSRLDTIMRALLRAANYEILFVPDVPAIVIIDEYVSLANDFYSGPEPDFVNASLDKLARQARPQEFGILGG